jgi:hypothetical protein
MIALKWMEPDADSSCLRLEDGKEGEFIRRRAARHRMS